MKLASFILNDTPTWGAVDGGSVIDLGGLAPTLKAALAGDLLGAAAERAAGQAPSAALADVDLLPVIPDPDKVICVGLNYKSHIEETGRSDSDYPVLFTRWANTQVGHGAPMIRPVNSTKFDYEGELAVVIGSAARHVEARPTRSAMSPATAATTTARSATGSATPTSSRRARISRAPAASGRGW